MPSQTDPVSPNGAIPGTLRAELVAAGHLSATATPRPLSGGRTNRLWHAPSPTGAVVIKVYVPDPQNPLFANDPAAEILLLGHLRGSGLAPRLRAVHEAESGPVVIYDLVPGQPWQSGVAMVARALRAVHETAPPPGLTGLPDGSTALAEQTRAILSRCPAEEQRFLSAYGDAETASRYQALAPWFHWRMAAYCLWRASSGATDYLACVSKERRRIIG